MIMIAILGLVIGSFIGALTWRLPRGKSISTGRSACPRCNKTISWYDNIPVISYLLLGGKCRNCKNKISPRYPIIEATTAILFVLIFQNIFTIQTNLPWLPADWLASLLIIIVITFIMITIFVIDLEHQLIFDSFVFSGLVVVLPFIGWEYLLAGFGAALFLLLVHLFTKGRGMGLGDVKLAILIGAMLGIKFTLIWMLLAFLTGAGAGVILILLNKSTLKTKIAFGPFLILAFFIVLFFKSNLNAIFLF